MRNARRFSKIILWSFAIALGLILYTVGLSHESLGYERRWAYPFLFSFVPAFCIQQGINYIFLRKQSKEEMSFSLLLDGNIRRLLFLPLPFLFW